jgi:hypothetical protein
VNACYQLVISRLFIICCLAITSGLVKNKLAPIYVLIMGRYQQEASLRTVNIMLSLLKQNTYRHLSHIYLYPL